MTRKVLPILALLLVGLVSDSRPAFASECFMNLRDCYYRAAARRSYFESVLASLDCEVSFAGCLRRDIWNG